jgi:hypothetical protein
MEPGSREDIYAAPATGQGPVARMKKVTRRKRRLSTRSRYPAPHREGHRITPRELRRRILFWSLLTALIAVGGYAAYRSRFSDSQPMRAPRAVDLVSPTGP